MTRAQRRNQARKTRAQDSLRIGSFLPAVALGLSLSENPNSGKRHVANLHQTSRTETFAMSHPS